MATRIPKLLVVDDDPASRRLVEAIFRPEGFEVVHARDGREGLEKALDDDPDLVVLDLQMPGMSGLEVLEELSRLKPDLPILVLSGAADLKTAVRATKLGAFDYLTKPVDPDDVVVVARRALETRALKREVDALRRRVDEGVGLQTTMGPSPEIADIVEQVRTVAESDFSVLVLGETGTGKELVAQAIHRQSPRRANALVALDCGAIPEPLLESELFGHEKGAFTGAQKQKRGRLHHAEGGTMFLDEVGNLPLALQVKLLRVLEAREVQAVGASHATPMNVRFVAATNDDLQARAADGRFRVDLYFRLAQYTITLPPLRGRTADIAYLANRFMTEASVELRRPVGGISPDAIAVLEHHPWPGNVRELRNVVRRAVLESQDMEIRKGLVEGLLGPNKAPERRSASSDGRTLREVADAAAREAERQIISETLALTHGNKSQAARALQTDYKTLHTKMKSLGIRARDFIP